MFRKFPHGSQRPCKHPPRTGSRCGRFRTPEDRVRTCPRTGRESIRRGTAGSRTHSRPNRLSPVNDLRGDAPASFNPSRVVPDAAASGGRPAVASGMCVRLFGSHPTRDPYNRPFHPGVLPSCICGCSGRTGTPSSSTPAAGRRLRLPVWMLCSRFREGHPGRFPSCRDPDCSGRMGCARRPPIAQPRLRRAATPSTRLNR